jgi:hypothetical protein
MEPGSKRPWLIASVVVSQALLVSERGARAACPLFGWTTGRDGAPASDSRVTSGSGSLSRHGSAAEHEGQTSDPSAAGEPHDGQRSAGATPEFYAMCLIYCG